MNIYLLDGKDMTDRETAYCVIERAMGFPKVGRLRDCLQVADPRSEKTPGARSETQPQLCFLSCERHLPK